MMRNGFLNETVTFSKEENTDAAIASQDAMKWATWANLNPHDSLRIWIIWKNQGDDTSKLVNYYKPNLTPCETFPNALGYAIHLGLKRFFFQQREYSTTPRNGGNQTSTNSTTNRTSSAQVSDVGPDPVAPVSYVSPAPMNKEMLRQEIMQEYQEAVNCGNKQELNKIYQKAKKMGIFTNQELADLRNARFHGKRAITNQGYADRQTERGNAERAERNQNRVTRHTDKMNQKLTNATQEE